jgi:hypothetical protein
MKRLALGLVSAAILAAIPAVIAAQEINVGVSVPLPSVSVAVEAPPPLEVQEPEMVVVPSGNDYIYMVPNTYGLYFHNGFWFRYYNGAWFRSAAYNSGWVSIGPRYVPAAVIGVYPEYAMFLPRGYYRIGWGDFHHHWRDWGHSHHWHGQPWYKNEIRYGRDRNRHIERERQKWQRGEGKSPHGFATHKAGPAPKGGVHKAGPAPKGGVHKAGPAPKGGVHKAGPAPKGSAHKAGPAPKGGVHKAGPAPKGGAHKAGPAPKGNAHKASPQKGPHKADHN